MKILRAFIVLLFLFFTFYATHKVKREVLSEKEEKEEVGTRAPDFNLKNLKGEEVSLKNLKGSAVILIFFATWCGPCKMELETIKEEETALANYNAKLFLISKDEKEKIKNFMEENGFDFDVLLDEKGDVSKNYNVKAIPKTVVLDEKGTIIFSKVGKINNIYDITAKIPYRFVIPNKERKIYKEVDEILDSIQCSCSCGKSILKCDCSVCEIKGKRESIKYYGARLMDREKFKKEQVAQIIKWKYIENIKEKK